MATTSILYSSDTAPLNSAIICSTRVTALNILSRGWLYKWSPNWVTSFLLQCRGRDIFFSVAGGQATEHGVPEIAAIALPCLGMPARRRHWAVEVWGEHPPHGSFGRSLCLSLLQLFLGVSATLIICRLCFLSLRQPIVAACWCGSSVSPLWALLVQVAASAPQTTGRLPTVSPDVVKLLAIMNLRKARLGSVCLHLDGNMAKAWQIEDLLRLCGPGQYYKK
jgi:hypothetical protein